MKKTIDLFCDIVDNYGDIGVVYRLGKELYNRNYKVRIFVNKLNEVSKIIKGFNSSLPYQVHNGIEFFDFNNFEINDTAEIIIEAFAVNIPESYLDKVNINTKLIINLEYLSAENWIEDFHLKNSFSPKPYIEKVFYMPGFTAKSGGIILDDYYLNLVDSIKKSRESYFNNFFKELGIKYSTDTYYINVFTYNWNFKEFIETLEKSPFKFIFFILDYKLNLNFSYKDNIEIYQMPFMDQNQFDIIINLSDFNFIRGEESFIRALLTGKPYLWNIYEQDEMLHIDKLEAFLERFREYFTDDYNLYHDLSLNFNLNNNFGNSFLEFIARKHSSFEDYKKFIVTNCNLVEKLLYFIDSRTNQNQEEI